MRKFALLLIVCMVLAFAGCATSTDTPSKVEPNTSGSSGVTPQSSDPSSSKTNEPIQHDYIVGDTIKVGDMEVTIFGVRTSEGADYFKPADGNVFYLMDIIIANKGQKSESISSMLMFDLRDKEGFSISQSFSAQTVGQSGLDGTVLPGKVIRGDIGYEVPKDPSGYELQINLSVFGSSGLFSVALDELSDDLPNLVAPVSTKSGNEIQIGETYTAGALEIVVNGISTSGGKDYFKPSEGNEFLLVDVSIKNNGTETESVSSMLMFNIRDAKGFSYSLSMGAASIGKGSLDGEIMAGKTLRGELGYEVTKDTEGLELFVSPSVFGSSDLFVVSLN